MSAPENTDEPERKSFCTFHDGRCRYENHPCPWGWLPVSYSFMPVMPVNYIKDTIGLIR